MATATVEQVGFPANFVEGLRRENGIASLLKFTEKLGEFLNSLPSDKLDVYRQLWPLYSSAKEILQYVVGDKRVDVDSLDEQLSNDIDDLFRKKKDLNELTTDFIRMCHDLKQRTVLEPLHVLLEISSDLGDKCRVNALIPKDNQPLMRISIESSDRFCLRPVLEESLANPELCAGISNVYERKIKHIMSRYNIDFLMFIERSMGPIGSGLFMLSELVSRLNLPACVFRQGVLSPHGQFVGTFPEQRHRVLVTYDLISTGTALESAARHLRDTHNVLPTAALTLFGYSPNIRSIVIDNGSFPVECMAYYDDFRDEAEQIRRSSLSLNSEIPVLMPQARNLSGASSNAQPPLEAMSPRNNDHGAPQGYDAFDTMEEQREDAPTTNAEGDGRLTFPPYMSYWALIGIIFGVGGFLALPLRPSLSTSLVALVGLIVLWVVMIKGPKYLDKKE